MNEHEIRCEAITVELAELAVETDLLAIKVRMAAAIDTDPRLEVGWHHLREVFADLDAALVDKFEAPVADLRMAA